MTSAKLIIIFAVLFAAMLMTFCNQYRESITCVSVAEEAGYFLGRPALFMILSLSHSSEPDTPDHFTIIKNDAGVLKIEPSEDLDLPVRWFFDPAPVEEGPYQISINTETFPLTVGGRVNPAYYARFQIKEAFVLDITAELPEGHTIHLQPQQYQDDLVVNSNGKLSLEIDKPGPRVLMMKSEDGELHTPLIILAESYRGWEVPVHEQMQVIFDVSHLAGKGSGQPQTQALQEVLDAVGDTEKGGTVYFGPGEYYTGHLEAGSNTRVFLAPGAVVYGHVDLASYYRPDGMVLFLFNNAENSGLSGPGVIDGNAHSIQQIEEDKISIHLVRFRNSQNMYARDVMLRNSVTWTFHVNGCDDVDIDGIRIIGDRGLPNVDGIDPDHSRDVRIANVFVTGSDDAIVVKTTGRFGMDGPAENIEVRNAVVMTPKTALKVGTESRADISNVLFENIDVIFSSRGLAAWMRDGHAYFDITFRNIRMNLYEFSGEAMSGEPFRFTIEDRDGVGSITNLTLENIKVRAPYRARFTGRESGHIENITLQDIYWKVSPARIKSPPDMLTQGWIVDPENELPVEGRPLITIHRLYNLMARDVTIDWREAPHSWDRLLDQQESRNIQVEDIEHLGYPFN